MNLQGLKDAQCLDKIAMGLEILINKRELRPAKKHGLGPV